MMDAFDSFYDRDMDAEIEAREQAERLQLDYEWFLDRQAGSLPAAEDTVVNRGSDE